MAKGWIKDASDEMDRKGAKGKFGPSTNKKIAAGVRKGGVEKKRAIFAKNMKAIARKRTARKKA